MILLGTRIKLLQGHLHNTRENEMINIESYGKLTPSPIASHVHKTIGLPHQFNVTVRSLVWSLQTHYVHGVYCCSTTKLSKIEISLYSQGRKNCTFHMPSFKSNFHHQMQQSHCDGLAKTFLTFWN